MLHKKSGKSASRTEKAPPQAARLRKPPTKRAVDYEDREPLPLVDDLPLKTKQRIAFQQAGDDAAFYAGEAEKYEALKKEAVSRAIAIAEEAGFERADGGTWTFSKTKGRRTLNQELLLENGVDTETIEASKKEGEPSYSVRRKPQRGPTS